MFIINSPLKIAVSSKKYFTLNLNIYRNFNRFALGTAKKNYENYIVPIIKNTIGYKLDRINVSYTYFTGSARLSDTHNVTCIHEKFFMDALVKSGVLIDDNYKFLNETTYRFGGIDRQNPRVEIRITPINSIKEKEDMKILLTKEDLAQAVRTFIESNNMITISDSAVVTLDIDGDNVILDVSEGDVKKESPKKETSKKATEPKKEEKVTEEPTPEPKKDKAPTKKEKEEAVESVTDFLDMGKDSEEELPFDVVDKDEEEENPFLS